MTSRLHIGVTGGIGSGKSIICRIFHTLGAPVYDADQHARELMEHDEYLIDSIRHTFGTQAYKNNGSLDRQFLAKATFGNPSALAQLNGLVHPRVALDYAAWAEHQHFQYVIREAALLYESGSYKSTNKMIVVTAPPELRIKRILQRDTQRSLADIEAIMSSQWPEEEKAKRADFLIQNDENQLIIPQVLALHQLFLS